MACPMSSIHDMAESYRDWKYCCPSPPPPSWPPTSPASGCTRASAAGTCPAPLNDSSSSRIMAESLGTITESHPMPLLAAPDRENEALPSVTTPSIAAIISQGMLTLGAAHCAICPSSKCQ